MIKKDEGEMLFHGVSLSIAVARLLIILCNAVQNHELSVHGGL